MGQVMTFPVEAEPEPPASQAARAHALYLVAVFGEMEPACFAKLLEVEARRYPSPEDARWARWTFQRYQEGRR